MYSRAARGRVPEYPRSVPTIDVDDAPVCEDTIVYEHWTDDEEREAAERAKKRQKTRQEAAETYLRGGEVVILTARLKGPFEGWRNPWASRTRRKDMKLEAEVPETTVRYNRSAPKQAGPLYMGNDSQRNPIDLEDDQDILVASALRGGPMDPFTAKNRAGPLPLAGLAPSSTARVEDWLKTSDVYARGPRSHAGSSPTPAARPPTCERLSPRPRSSPVQKKPSNQESVLEQVATGLEVGKDVPTSRPGTASSVPSHESHQRAEAAILEQKRKSLHTVPPSTHLPAFEYRRPRRGERKGPTKQQAPDLVTSEALQTTTAVKEVAPAPFDAGPLPQADQSKATDKLASKPALSTETSKTSTVPNMPSAQVAPAPHHVPSVANNHSTNDLLQELRSTTRSQVQKEKTAKTGKDVTARTGAFEEDESKRKSEEERPDMAVPLVDAVTAASPNHETPARELETQEMIAAIKPFDFSTIKKPRSGFTGLESPVTAMKDQTRKSGNRASFAGDQPLSDDSQTSIKAGMKVKKVTTTASSGKGPPKVPLFEETSTGAAPALRDDDLLDESLPSISSMFGNRQANAPRSILKSSNAISSAPGLSGNTSASLRREAQIPSGQPGQKAVKVDLLTEDDSFDLNAAIDDLGSYLGTWDADEEATKLVA